VLDLHEGRPAGARRLAEVRGVNLLESRPWPMWLRELARELAIACTGDDWPGRRAQARRIVAAIEKHELEPRPVRTAAPAAAEPGARPTGRIDKSGLAFAPPSGGSPKAARRAERAAGAIGRLRILVVGRKWFGNLCEFCRAGEPETMHHVLKGSERVTLEDETSCAAICDDCDKRTEASPAWARGAGRIWAMQMAGEARRRGLLDLAAGFDRTAEILDGKIALATAKGVTTTPTGAR
jgi:hypothetical protein